VLDQVLADDSPVPPKKREELKGVLEVLFEPYRQILRQGRGRKRVSAHLGRRPRDGRSESRLS
jgi:hypothetical protein